MESSTVTVYARPLKLVGLVFAIFSFVLLMVTLIGSYWIDVEKQDDINDGQDVFVGHHYQGLWRVCTNYVFGQSDPLTELTCSDVEADSWIAACRGFVFIPLLLNIISIITAIFAYVRRISFYIPSLLSVVAGFLLLLPLIIYPAMFQYESMASRLGQWELGWTYGVGWGALVFLIAAGILMVFGRKDEEVQKTYYTSNY